MPVNLHRPSQKVNIFPECGPSNVALSVSHSIVQDPIAAHFKTRHTCPTSVNFDTRTNNGLFDYWDGDSLDFNCGVARLPNSSMAQKINTAVWNTTLIRIPVGDRENSPKGSWATFRVPILLNTACRSMSDPVANTIVTHSHLRSKAASSEKNANAGSRYRSCTRVGRIKNTDSNRPRPG